MSTKDHNCGGKSWVLPDPRVSVFFEGDIENLMRCFYCPMPSDDGEPLLYRQSIGRLDKIAPRVARSNPVSAVVIRMSRRLAETAFSRAYFLRE
jgi:hypothetical protein